MKKSIIILFSISLMVSGCAQTRDEQIINTIVLNELLIPEDAFPIGWSFAGSGPGIDPDRSFDSVGETFYSDIYMDSMGCSENIYRQKKAEWAIHDYQYSVVAFGQGLIPEEWTFTSPYADESHFACSYYQDTDFPVCSWMARYDRIVINFDCWLIPDRMNLSLMKEIITNLDNKAAETIINNTPD
jgi:hypothetical protein